MNFNKIKVIKNPVFALIIDDIFDKEINNEILDEAISNKENFKIATVGGATSNTDIDYRSNTVSYYDNLYEKRSDSPLLSNLDKLITSKEFKSILLTSVFPLNLISNTNKHETQVSRYGDENKYIWHIDSIIGTNQRIITLVYYFNKEPKKFSGGNISLTDSPLYNWKTLVDDNPNIIDIEPKNNRLVVFASSTLHSVNPVINKSFNFEDGRFSANCWVGFQ